MDIRLEIYLFVLSGFYILQGNGLIPNPDHGKACFDFYDRCACVLQVGNRGSNQIFHVSILKSKI